MRIGPFGAWEIVVILMVATIVFGPRHLPDMAKGLGRSVRVFRRELHGLRQGFEEESSARERAAAPAPGAGPLPPVDGADSTARPDV